MMAARDDELARAATGTQQRGPITDYFGAGPLAVERFGPHYLLEGQDPEARIALCRCVHGIEWPEGDLYEGNGGSACPECCDVAHAIPRGLQAA